jgi:glycine/D-amino acid oxidase-like deaminating enzyme
MTPPPHSFQLITVSMFRTSKQTYPTYKNPCGWNALLPIRAPSLAVPATRRFDTIVIGAGYTGLAAARRIAESRPDKAVLILDAGIVGEGSAGRNSGFVINLPHNTRLGGHHSPTESARKQIRVYAAGLSWLENLVRKHRIECDWSPIGKFHAAATEGGERNLRATLNQYRTWGIRLTEYSRESLREKIGSDYFHYGFHSLNNVFVQPASLIRGLADSLPPNVTLLEDTAVLGISANSPFSVATSKGEFISDQLVVANNGFARSLGLLRDRLITIFTYAAITPPLPQEELRKLGNKAEWGVIPANRLGATLRRTSDGRLLVRSGYSYEREQAPCDTLALLTDIYRRRYPKMRSHSFDYLWGGTTALTRNGATFFGQPRPGLYVSAGCNGAGVLKGTTFGKLLGEMVVGAQSRDLTDVLAMEGPSWIPPEPFRRIGVLSSIRYQATLAGLER